MGWTVGSIPVSCVAGIAISWQCCVVIVHMALYACDRDMRTGQRERGRVVIECRAGPGRSIVASGASCGETDDGMRWACCAIPRRCVAGVAIGRQRCVVVIHVARRARHSDVRAGQWERRCVVNKSRPTPVRGRVARSTSCGETHCGMGRIVGPSEISFVAGVAIGRHCRVVIVRMALCAWNRKMCAGQRKGPRRVIESSLCPAACCMAERAVGREARRNVIWACGPRECCLMA